MAGTPRFKVYNPNGEYVASCKYAEDAAMIVGNYGDGGSIRDGHSKIVWREGAEDIPAAESWDQVASTICNRIRANRTPTN